MVSDRSVFVRVKGDVSDFNRAMMQASASAKAFTRELDTSTDRSTMLTQSLLAIGPALVPITAAAIPAISGMTNQLAFAAAGVGVAALAFQGFGDALKATNDYAIDPTDANLQKMQETMSALGPAGREFVGFLQEMRPEVQKLQNAAQDGLFPGMQAGLDDLMTRFPQVERIISEVASASGDLLAEAGDNLASDRWSEFFDFLETEARPTLMDFGRSVGNLTEGFANLWMAFDPLSDNFSKGFLQMSRDFATWTDGLSETQGFQEFLDYIERTGPKVWDTLGALGNALLQIVEAAAPVGEVALPAIEAIADVIATIANSPAGPVLIGAAAGISALSRAVSLFSVANGGAITGMLDKVGGKGAALRSAAAGIGVLGLAMTDLDDKLGVTNTATLGLVGLTAGPLGAAFGLAAGLAMDYAAGNDAISESMDKASKLIGENAVSLDEQAAALQKARDAVAEGPTGVAGLFGDAPGQAAATAISFKVLQDQYDANSRAAQDLRFQEGGLGDSMSSASDTARGYMDTLLALADAHNKAANQALTSREAERAYQEAIDNAADSVKKNGRTIDEQTPAGRANQEALDGIASAWNKLDTAGREASGGIDKARKTFTAAAIAAGYGEDQAAALARTLLNIDPPPPINISLPGIKQAITDAGALGTALSNLRDKTINIRTVVTGGGNGAALGIGSMNGNIFAPYANGGIEQHVAQIAPGNVTRIWAEPETGGEAYIPLAASKRPRSRNIAEQTVGILGGSVEWFANGGISSRYDDFSNLTQSTRLDIERQKLRIQDIAQSLRETETYGKGKNKKRRKVLRGRAKTVAELELTEAKAELQTMLRENKQLKNYGTEDEEKALDEQAQRIADEASNIMSTKKSAADKFDIMTGGSAAAVDRNLSRVLANSQEFLGLLSALKAKGASPWLLEQFVAAGPTGGAIRLARQYVSDQAAFDSIQSRASQIDAYTNQYAGLVGSANFLNPGAYNSGIPLAPQAPMTASIVGAEIAVGENGLVKFVQGQIIVSQDAQAQEARFATR